MASRSAQLDGPGDVIFNGSRAALPEAARVFPGLRVILVTAPAAVLAARLARPGPRERGRHQGPPGPRRCSPCPRASRAETVLNDSTPEAGHRPPSGSPSAGQRIAVQQMEPARFILAKQAQILDHERAAAAPGRNAPPARLQPGRPDPRPDGRSGSGESGTLPSHRDSPNGPAGRAGAGSGVSGRRRAISASVRGARRASVPSTTRGAKVQQRGLAALRASGPETRRRFSSCSPAQCHRAPAARPDRPAGTARHPASRPSASRNGARSVP